MKYNPTQVKDRVILRALNNGTDPITERHRQAVNILSSESFKAYFYRTSGYKKKPSWFKNTIRFIRETYLILIDKLLSKKSKFVYWKKLNELVDNITYRRLIKTHEALKDLGIYFEVEKHEGEIESLKTELSASVELEEYYKNLIEIPNSEKDVILEAIKTTEKKIVFLKDSLKRNSTISFDDENNPNVIIDRFYE